MQRTLWKVFLISEWACIRSVNLSRLCGNPGGSSRKISQESWRERFETCKVDVFNPNPKPTHLTKRCSQGARNWEMEEVKSDDMNPPEPERLTVYINNGKRREEKSAVDTRESKRQCLSVWESAEPPGVPRTNIFMVYKKRQQQLTSTHHIW